MKSLSTKEFHTLLSSYIDGELGATSKAEFEEYLSSNSEARLELEKWRAQSALLKSKPGIQPNAWLWQSVSQRLERQKTSHLSFFPFSRRYVPLAASLALVMVGLVGVLLYQQRVTLKTFFFEKKEQVAQLYQENILQGKLFPLFTNLDKDQVLQFALFGTLPLDAQAKTALRVDDSKENGTRIEFAKNETRQNPAVTVEEFYREIDATPAQHRVVDSILSSARVKIQESVFLSENRSLAVHADLPKFNRTMMSQLAASLESAQRKKFRKFLVASHSPYTFVVAAAPAPGISVHAPRTPKAPGMDQFVVITPESCAIARINIELEDVQRRVGLTSEQIRSMDERTHALIREFASHTRMRRTPTPSLSIFSDSDYFSIKVENSVLEPSQAEMPFEVVARAPRTLRFKYEMRQMPNIPNFPDEESAPSVGGFPNGAPTPPPDVEGSNARSGRTLDLDSLISAPRDRKSQPKSVQPKKRRTNPFEL